MRWAWFVVAPFLACAEGTRVVPRVPELLGQSYVVAELGPDDAVRALRAYASLPDPLEIEDTKLWILAYDRAIAAELTIEPDGALNVRGPEASADEAWSLPAPDRAFELAVGAEALVPRTSADAAIWLSRVRVARPPCKPLPSHQPITGIAGRAVVNAVLRFGPDVILAVGSHSGQDAALYRLRPGETEARPMITLTDIRGGEQPLLALIDGERLHLVWSETGRADDYQRIELDRGYREVDRHALPIEGAPPETLLLDLAGQRFGGEMTAVARAREYVPASIGNVSRSHLFAFDRELRTLRLLASGPLDELPACGSVFDAQVLQVDRPDGGLVGMLLEPLRRFEIGHAGGFDPLEPPLLERPLCRSALTALSNGAELLVNQGLSGDRDIELLWRIAEGDWAPLGQPTTLVAQLARSFDDLVLVSASQRLLAVYETSTLRPDLPPRYCGALAIGCNSFHAAQLEGGAVVVGGTGTHAAVLLVRE